ncbi:hypothetical protein MN033_17630 [Bacillus nitratireducens]|uniref:hypothetical protein n=1 Tax=Bacillus nitratireducens TaxID=2026193 RepID=UPI0005CCA45E|nr:hypothetical protein [Bacillus nitratireducens]UNP75084.1 hypothetical protein MN033_17630 [Bacillus nitratireducens]SIR22133.1 hypothetical protein SAMN05878494_3152 [Bacillus cereus]
MARNSLDKITLGLAVDEINKEIGLTKTEPTPMNDEAIYKLISARNEPIVVATPHSIMRFRKSKNKEEQENPTDYSVGFFCLRRYEK